MINHFMDLLVKFGFVFILAMSSQVIATSLDKTAVNEFIEYMVTTHKFNEQELRFLFDQTIKSSRVLAAISKPAESLPWYKYQSLFIQSERINQGIQFWKRYASVLNRAETEYGVPPRLIVAIIGVETRYGMNKGNDRVMDALATLAFHYPKRGTFFRGELEHFLLLTREQKIAPLSLKGSYAGAMGMPQFIPSSYRNYAVDFDHDGKIDIWDNPVDAIGSVANYFKQHGWEAGHAVVLSGKANSERYQDLLKTDLKPDVPASELKNYDILTDVELSPGTYVNVMSLEGSNGKEIWLGLENFYVITRYNHSPLYALAVYQLADAIQKKYTNTIAVIKNAGE